MKAILVSFKTTVAKLPLLLALSAVFVACEPPKTDAETYQKPILKKALKPNTTAPLPINQPKPAIPLDTGEDTSFRTIEHKNTEKMFRIDRGGFMPIKP